MSNEVTINAWSACLFLPDYLCNEVFADAETDYVESLEEFAPAILYHE